MIEKKKKNTFIFLSANSQIEEENLVLLPASPLSLSRSFPLFSRVSDAWSPPCTLSVATKASGNLPAKEERNNDPSNRRLRSSRRSTTTATAAATTTTTMRHRSRRPCTRTMRRSQQRREQERDRGRGPKAEPESSVGVTFAGQSGPARVVAGSPWAARREASASSMMLTALASREEEEEQRREFGGGNRDGNGRRRRRREEEEEDEFFLSLLSFSRASLSREIFSPKSLCRLSLLFSLQFFSFLSTRDPSLGTLRSSSTARIFR